MSILPVKDSDDWVKEFESMNRQMFTETVTLKEIMNLQSPWIRKNIFIRVTKPQDYCDKWLCITRKYEGIKDRITMVNLTIMLSN